MKNILAGFLSKFLILSTLLQTSCSDIISRREKTPVTYESYNNYYNIKSVFTEQDSSGLNVRVNVVKTRTGINKEVAILHPTPVIGYNSSLVEWKREDILSLDNIASGVSVEVDNPDLFEVEIAPRSTKTNELGEFTFKIKNKNQPYY